MRFAETQAQATRRVLVTVADGVDTGMAMLSTDALCGFNRAQLRVAMLELEASGVCERLTPTSWSFSVEGVEVVARVGVRDAVAAACPTS